MSGLDLHPVFAEHKMDDRCLLLFIRNPQKGKVKTRLAATIGDDVTLELYRQFVLSMLSTIKKGGFPFHICLHPKRALNDLKGWLGPEYRYLPQRGRDLGERMKNGFLDTFTRGFEKVVLIGSDIPDLPPSFIEEAFASLSEMDAVIGPSYDGGYYLIGFKNESFSPRVFEGIAWGTEKIFKGTIQILRDEKRKLYILPRWRDIDSIEDLKDLSTPPFNIPGRMKRPAM